MLETTRNVVAGAEPGRRADLFEAVLDAVPAGVALLRGAELVFELANPRFVSLTGAQQVLGRSLAEVWPEAAARIIPVLRSVLETGERFRAVDVPLRVRRSAGAAPEPAWFTLEVQRITAGAGEVDAVLATAMETTASMSARRASEAAADAAARAGKRAELLASLAADLNRRIGLPSVLGTALQRVHELLRADDGSIYLLEPERRVLRGLAERKPLGRVGLEVQLPDLPNVARAVEAREPVYFTRAETAGAEVPWFERNRIAACLVLPMVANDRCIGALFLNDYGDATPPAPDEVAFARGVAAHCAGAITRAMAFEAEREARARAEIAEAMARRAARRLAISQDLTAALSSAHDVAQVTAIVGEKGLAAVDAVAGSISLRRGEDLVLAAAFQLPDEYARASAETRLDAATPVADVARTGQPLFATAFEAVAARWPSALPPAELRAGAWVWLPLVTDDEVRGVLALCYAEPRDFDLEERAFLASVGRKCAQALDRARLFEAERAAREDAERVGKLQEQLIAVVGHDLRTPLSAISMAVSIMFRRGGLDERQAQTLSRIASSSQRMAGIIRDLLDFSRARQGAGIPMERGPLDLREVAERAVLELQAVHPQTDLRLRVVGDVRGEGDSGRMAQVISNLAGNAIQHGLEGAPVDVLLDGSGDDLVLSVHNDGPAIPAELQPTIFEPFRRGDRRNDSGSIGLGLFIVREIVRAHGGAVEVRSVEGEGTTFTVRLPRR